MLILFPFPPPSSLAPLIPLSFSTTTSRKTQLPIKGLGTRLSTQKVLESLHLILTATALEHGVAVAAAFGGVHGVGGENGVEHVGAVDLGAGILLLV